MKQSQFLITILLAMVPFLTGCTKKQDSTRSQRSPELVIVGWPGPEGKALEAVVNVYNESQGKEDNIQARVIYFSREGTVEKLAASLAAETTDYDIFTGNNFIVGRFLEFTSPIDEAFGSNIELFRATFPDSIVQLQTVGDRLSGFPTDISLHFLYYREDLINQLLSNPEWQKIYKDVSLKYLRKELSPKRPEDWSWEDFYTAALFFTQSINPLSPVKYGTALQLKNLLYNIMIWNGMLASEGGRWYDEAGNVAIDSPATRKALLLYKNIVKNGATPQSSNSYEFSEANAAFGSGQVAFMIQWNAAVNMVKDASIYPDVAPHVAVAPQPQGSAGRKTHMHGITLALNKFSSHRENALKFFRYLTEKKAIGTYIEAGGSFPNVEVINEKAKERPELVTMVDHVKKYGMVMDGSMTSNGEKIFSMMAEYFTGYWAGQIDLDTAIKNVSEGLEKYKVTK